METQILEGTPDEIRRKLRELPFAPGDRLRVVVSRAHEPPPEPGGGSFVPSEYRNGVPLLPRRHLDRSVDLDLIQRLLDEEDREGSVEP
jgi:hypothetical protein